MGADFDTISSSIKLSAEERRENLSIIEKELGVKIREPIQRISDCAAWTVSAHERFLDHFALINSIISHGKIRASDQSKLIKSYKLWNSDYINIMRQADLAIIETLNVFEYFTERALGE